MQDTNTGSPEEKVYVLVRADLPPGLQMAQAIHAAVALTMDHPERMASTPNVVVLSVEGEDELLGWADEFVDSWARGKTQLALFREPDLDDEATALAIFSDGRAFANLPLAGRVMQPA